MAASKYKLAIEQGATYPRVFTWKAGDPATPVDLTGCTARLQIRGRVTDADVLYEMTSEPGGGLVLGDAAGTIALTIPDEDSAEWTWRSGVYDLEIAFPDGTVRRLLRGGVSVSPEVTR